MNDLLDRLAKAEAVCRAIRADKEQLDALAKLTETYWPATEWVQDIANISAALEAWSCYADAPAPTHPLDELLDAAMAAHGNAFNRHDVSTVLQSAANLLDPHEVPAGQRLLRALASHLDAHLSSRQSPAPAITCARCGTGTEALKQRIDLKGRIHDWLCDACADAIRAEQAEAARPAPAEPAHTCETCAHLDSGPCYTCIRGARYDGKRADEWEPKPAPTCADCGATFGARERLPVSPWHGEVLCPSCASKRVQVQMDSARIARLRERIAERRARKESVFVQHKLGNAADVREVKKGDWLIVEPCGMPSKESWALSDIAGILELKEGE